MEIVTQTSELKSLLKPIQKKGQSIGFVPTMGNLHDGHLSLVRAAKQVCDIVVTSIYINPTQFGPSEDFNQYPRTEANDRQRLSLANNDILFLPTSTDMYPNGEPGYVNICVPKISRTLCGISRPHHFDGVALVVSKLFNMVMPNIAFFGNKDFQQLLVIKQLTQELAFPIEIIGVPIARELNGLAMSSRNQYLSSPQKQTAGALYQQLTHTKEQLTLKLLTINTPKFDVYLKSSIEELAAKGFKVEYFEVRNQSDLSIPKQGDKALILLIAAKLGQTRLIDNLPVDL